MPDATFSQERRKRSRGRTQLLQGWRVFAGIGSAVVSPLLRLWLGDMSTISTALIAIAVGGATYALLLGGEYAYKFLFVVPAEMWDQAQTKIGELDETVRNFLDRDWPVAIKPETSRALIAALFRAREFQIYHHPSSNCADFARLLSDVLVDAGWRNSLLHPVGLPRSMKAGVLIIGRVDHAPAQLGKALGDILKIDAMVEIQDSPRLQIQIGPKRIAII